MNVKVEALDQHKVSVAVSPVSVKARQVARSLKCTSAKLL